ncbi:MAG: diaminopimelate epimerase [Candidatus Methanoperedens sp.]|nr:diaminopimelate epimerase [Candidatus Methanoperedens sp.]MCE8424703.1 diaminopimelate epimerase [Candidatus Methanoperedens sp.]MCE8427141.1 diaminopimelate epimerase [Candidatus Methanoperedens sp.]
MIHFTKLHGNGNDFILVDEFNEVIIPEKEKAAFVAKYCDRRFGIGGDGVLFLGKSDKADIRMRIFNSDGTEAEMCGNGVRCLVKYAFDEGYIKGNSMVETLAGVLPVECRIEDKTWVKVNMGRPQFSRENLPAKGTGEFIDVALHGYKVSVVNTGVPHAVIFTASLDDRELMLIAPKIRYDPIFPKGTNVNFVRVDSHDEMTIHTYERGVEAETLSCGTGSVACAAVARKLGKTGKSVKVNTKGGVLMITLAEDAAFMEGTADRVFDGTIS